jgi:sodium transport system permease protein
VSALPGRFSLVRVVLRKELKDNLRDKRSMSSGFLMPLLGPLMFLLSLTVVAGMNKQDKPLKVPIRGAQYAPTLVAYLERNGVEVQPAGPDTERLVRDGKLDVALDIPESFGKEFTEGRTARVEIIVDGSSNQSRAPFRRLQRLLNGYSSTLGALRLLARGVSPSLATPLQVEEVDLATPERTAAAVLTMIPLFLLMAVFMGGMYLAIDATAGERERGSLEPLLINPVTRAQVVLGKWTAVVLVSWAALLVALAGFSLALQRAPLQELGIRAELGGLTSLKLVLVLLPLSLFASGLQMLLSLFARTFKEAQTYLQLMVLVPMIPGMITSLSPVEAKAWMMTIPIFSQTLLLSDVLRGNPVPPAFHALAAVATIAAAAGTVAAAVWMLGKEKIVFGRGAGG